MKVSRGNRRNMARNSDDGIYSFAPNVNPIGHVSPKLKGKYIPAGENKNIRDNAR